MSLFTKLLIILLAISAGHSFAYPQFIGHGYTSCLTCHYNPLGNGPLTDYGRAVSATALAGRDWYSSTTTEDTIANHSGFLFSNWDKNKYIRPSINYRQLYLTRKVGTEKEQKDQILMMLSANIVVKNADNTTYFVGEIGQAPEPTGGRADTEEEPNIRSREHYIAHRFAPSWGVYLGLMDKAFGIRIDDHTAYSRSTNGLAQNDQSHGILVHYVGDKFEGAINYFMGNLQQDQDLRQVGGSTTFEYTIGPMTRIGASLLSSKSDYVADSATAIHSRIGFGKGSSVMLEIGDTKRQAVEGDKGYNSRYYFMQNQISLRRGLYFNYALEWFIPDVEENAKSLRLGPGIQWMPGQRVEFRFDLYNSRAFNPNGVAEDTWDFAGQIHLWF